MGCVDMWGRVRWYASLPGADEAFALPVPLVIARPTDGAPFVGSYKDRGVERDRVAFRDCHARTNGLL